MPVSAPAARNTRASGELPQCFAYVGCGGHCRIVTVDLLWLLVLCMDIVQSILFCLHVHAWAESVCMHFCMFFCMSVCMCMSYKCMPGQSLPLKIQWLDAASWCSEESLCCHLHASVFSHISATNHLSPLQGALLTDVQVMATSPQACRDITHLLTHTLK